MKTQKISNFLSTNEKKGIKRLLHVENEFMNTNTVTDTIKVQNYTVTRYISEYWTSRQRQASSIHEISYRACFKPQLPRFFIKKLTKKGEIVYDPFSGRGTTVIEAALLGRNIILNDINPLSKILTYPRFYIPSLGALEERLRKIEFDYSLSSDIDLSMFYHKKTLSELLSIRDYLNDRKKNKKEDHLDRWIRMVATNRLTGHSSGFFSVYTLPPNQAVSPNSQIKINQKRDQTPEYRDTQKLILKKTNSLIKGISHKDKIRLSKVGNASLLLTKDARNTPEIDDHSVTLLITSPPFLDIVQYSKDNWLRCWFNSIDDKEISKRITMAKKIDDWTLVMKDVFQEFYRIISPGGHVCFEVGEVRKGKIKLDEVVVPLGIETGFECNGILINSQTFTKTSNIWGINNNKFGTNTNRIVIFKKPE